MTMERTAFVLNHVATALAVLAVLFFAFFW